MSAGVDDAILTTPGNVPRVLPIVIVGLVIVGVLFAVLSKPLGHLITKALTHYAPPDPYRLQQHYSAEADLLGGMAHREPKTAEEWLAAAQFELDDNSPYGAQWCLDRANEAGANATEVKALQAKIRLANGRWIAIHNALLKNHRYADGNNVYADIYPIVDRLRAEDTPNELTGKPRADLDLLHAHLLLREGRRTEARPILAALAEQPWPLQGLAAYLHAKTWLREADSSTARRLFTDYLARFPGERLNAYAAYELGNLALKAGDADGAMTWFKEVFTKYDNSPQAHAAQLAMFDIAMGVVPEAAPSTTEASPEESLFDLGAAPEATSEATEPKDGGTPAGTTPPVLEAAEEVSSPSGLDGRLIADTVEDWNRYGQLFSMAHDSVDVQRRAIALYKDLILPAQPPLKIWTLLTAESALGWATALAEGGVEQGAIRLCDWGIMQPGNPDVLVATARLRGRLLIGQRKFAEARTGLEGARNLLAGKTDVAPVDYELARSWRLDSNAGRARGWYLKAANSPNPLIAADALAQAAWAAAQSGDWELALTDYKSLNSKYADSVYAEAAREHLLSDALRRGQELVAVEFARQLKNQATKGGRHVRGAYFDLTLGNKADERQAFFNRYALTYYGTLVAESLDHAYDNWSPSAADLTFAGLRSNESSIAGATFLAGLWDLTDAELDASPPDSLTESFPLLQRALITANEGVPKHTILDSQSFLDRGGPADVPPGWTDLLLDAAYPLEYLAETQVEADRYNFPVELLLGIIRQESFFNPKAKSTAGARGLMQLMPATGTWAGQQVGMGKLAVTEFEKPATNLRLATWHLDFLRRAGGTSFGLMLAAHNGGPGNLAKWQARYGGPGVPDWLFLELIPNQESREFVRQVTANQAAYTYLLARDRRQGAF